MTYSIERDLCSRRDTEKAMKDAEEFLDIVKAYLKKNLPSFK